MIIQNSDLYTETNDIKIIFSFLNTPEIIHKCRLISKSFKNVIDSSPILFADHAWNLKLTAEKLQDAIVSLNNQTKNILKCYEMK